MRNRPVAPALISCSRCRFQGWIDSPSAAIHLPSEMSENPGKAVIPHRPHVFPIACWALGLVGFSELIVGGLALAARMEDSKQVRVIEKEVQKIITVEVPAKRADGDDASVVARPPGVNPAPPLPVAPVMPEPTPIDAPKIADPIAEKLVGEGRKARVNGDMGLAILKLTESLKQAPDDPSVLYELGLVHEAMGIYDQAAAYYQKVFEKGVSGAGALYELSAKKLSDGFEQPADLLGKLALGRVRIFKDPREDNQRVILTIPVQKVPDPTADGIASEASNRAVPAWSAFVTVSPASPRIGLA